MRLSGFTIARNALRYGYPLEESLRSLLPLVDELVVAVGKSEDRTLELVRSIRSPKIKAFQTQWDPAALSGGRVLSQQTNLALARCSGDWAVYLQADEVLHEDDLALIEASCARHWRTPVEGLRFSYLHFYGSYGTLQAHWRKWYRSAVRAVKTGRGVVSVGDAYGFRVRQKNSERRLLSLGCGARVFHYGWCRPPGVMERKQRNLDSLYHGAAPAARAKSDPKVAAFYADLGHLRAFRGSHPRVMQARVAAQDWRFDDGIARQYPWWMRQLQILFLYPFQKWWRSWRNA